MSVIVPTYNRPGLLAEALQSIRDQTWSNIQIIVINDAGEDVEAVVRPYLTGPQDHALCHTENKGLAAARNTGIRHALGDYIAYLDDDDRFLPSHLSTVVGFLEAHGAVIAYADAWRVIYRSGPEGLHEVERVRVSDEFDRNRLLLNNYLPVQSFVHARSCFDATGLFDEQLFRYEDWDLWIRMMQHFEIHHLAEITTEYRWVDDGTTMSSGSRKGFIDARERIYRKNAGFLHAPIQALEATVIEQRDRIRYLEGYLEKFRRHPLYKIYARIKGIH